MIKVGNNLAYWKDLKGKATTLEYTQYYIFATMMEKTIVHEISHEDNRDKLDLEGKWWLTMINYQKHVRDNKYKSYTEDHV